MAHYLELSVSGESLTLPLVGAYTGTIETYSGVITNITGTGQSVITGAILTQITKITATDSNGSHSYNPTLSAEAGGTLLIDEVGGNHGTLNGFSADPFVYYYDFLNPADEDTTNDNCLVFDANINSYVDIPDYTIATNDVIELEVMIPVAVISYGFFLDGYIDGDGGRFYFGVRDGNFYTRVGGSASSLGSYNTGEWYKVEITRTGSNWTFDINGSISTLTFTAEPLPIRSINASSGSGFNKNFNVKNVKLGSDRFYDFNRSPATAPVVPELINNQNGTMVGFPEPSGYVKNASNEIIGYQLNGVDTYFEIPDYTLLAGDYIEVKFRLDNASKDFQNILYFYTGVGSDYFAILNTGALELRVQGVSGQSSAVLSQGETYTLTLERGVSNYIVLVDGVSVLTLNTTAQIAPLLSLSSDLSQYVPFVSLFYVKVVSATDNRFYDFTLGDDDEIIDTVGGNNADIINAPTAGYLPIIEKQVFTVGTGKDYPDLNASKAAVTDTDYLYEFLLFGTMPDTGDVVFIDAGSNLLFSAGDNAFSKGGDITIPHLDNVSIKGGNSSTLRYDELIGNKFTTGNYGAVKSITISSCYFFGGNLNRIVGQSSSSLDIQISNSLIANYRQGITTSFNTADFYDCIIGNIGGYASSVGLSSGMQAVNCIGFQNDQAYNSSIPIFGSGVTGSNNVSQDISATTNNIGTQLADINTAFNDPDNGDYRVLQTYADNNLVGQGWNGSDIGASFYFDGDSGGGYSLTLTQAAFNFAGSDIGTVKDSIVSISSGSANLSGEDTETLKGSLISADSGSVSITGRGVDLRRNALLSINTGSATFAGDDIAINKVTVNDLVLSLDSGNTVMRGVPVDLLADRLAAIETGSYALTGQDFTIKAGRKVTLGNGEARLNGQPLSIVYTPAGGYTIALGTGGALLTGGSITTVADRIAQIEAGSTDLIGNVIELSAHRKINPEPGSLTLTGQQIDCLYGRAITIEPTAFTLTGAQVILDYSGFVEVRLNGYSLRFEQSLIQPTFNQSLINMRFGA